MPLRPSPFLTGREALLTYLHEALQDRGAVALTGLGGIGKTQAALAYAYGQRQDYSAVLWVRAATRDELIAGFTTLATVLGLPERNAAEQAQSVAAVRRWLEQSSGWLLILDNADDLSLAREFLPVHRPGWLLLTTRASATGEVAAGIEVECLPPDVGALFLLRRTKRLAPAAPLATASPEDQAAARTVAQELGGLPLALDQAGAYLEEMQLTPGEYLSLYRQAGRGLRAQRGELAADHPSVTVTFSLAFAQVAAANPAAAELLRLCAFLDPSGIPEELLSEGAAELGPVLGPVLAQPLGLIDIRHEAGRFSLLHRDPDRQTLLIHPVVQAVVRDEEMDESEQRQWKERTVRAVSRIFPEIKFQAWPLCERLLPHAQVCAKYIEKLQFTFEEAAYLLNQTALYLYERVRYFEAELLFKSALIILEENSDPENLKIAMALKNLALVYNAQGNYQKAESFCKEALRKIVRETPNKNILEEKELQRKKSLADCYNSLAMIHEAQGKYAKAEPYYKRALNIRKKTLGVEHPDTAESLNYLAKLSLVFGNYHQAKLYFQNALNIRQKTLGLEHPDTAQSLNNLGLLYYHQGRYEEAETLYKQALEIWEKSLGSEHTAVAKNLNNLALLYYQQAKYSDAEKFYRRALDINKKYLGLEHPKVALILNNLGLLNYSLQKYKDAELLYDEAIKIWKKSLGWKHPDTAQSLNNLGLLYYDQGKYEEAEVLYKEALEIWEKSLGYEHPQVASALNNIGLLYHAQRRYSEAEKFYLKAISIWRIKNHPDIIKCWYNLALLYSIEGKCSEIENVNQEVEKFLKNQLI